MSSDWTAHLLVPEGQLATCRPEEVVALLGRFGFGAREPGKAIVHGTTADGMDDLTFSTYEEGWIHLRTEGGLVSLRADDGEEVWLSVHLAEGMLAIELQVHGEAPSYDEVQVTISSRAARSRGVAWTFVDQGLTALASTVRARYGWGLWEEALERFAPLAIHAAVASDSHLLVSFDWSVAPHESAIGRLLNVLCQESIGSCRRVGRLIEHRLNPDVTAVPVDDLQRACAAVARLRGQPMQ